MSVYKRGGIYQVEIRKRGFERVRVTTGSRVKEVADAIEGAILWLMARGRHDLIGLVREGKLSPGDLLAAYEKNRNDLDHLIPAPESPILGGLVNEWLDWMRSPSGISDKTGARFAPNTIHRYESSWAKLFKVSQKGRDTRLDELTDGLIAAYRAARAKNRSPATINRDLVAIASFLSWCRDIKGIDHPPLRLKRQREPSGRERWLSGGEVEAFRSKCPDDWWPLFALLLCTGMRIGEAQGLRWGDVNFGFHRISIHDGDRRLKTKASNRDVPICDALDPVLTEWATVPADRAEPVFPDSYGNYVVARRVFRDVCMTAGLCDGGKRKKPNVRLHDLRHTFGVHAALQGVPVTSLQRLLGHSTAVMTLRYMKYADEALHQADVAKVAQSILGRGAGLQGGVEALPSSAVPALLPTVVN